MFDPFSPTVISRSVRVIGLSVFFLTALQFVVYGLFRWLDQVDVDATRPVRPDPPSVNHYDSPVPGSGTAGDER